MYINNTIALENFKKNKCNWASHVISKNLLCFKIFIENENNYIFYLTDPITRDCKVPRVANSNSRHNGYTKQDPLDNWRYRNCRSHTSKRRDSKESFWASAREPWGNYHLIRYQSIFSIILSNSTQKHHIFFNQSGFHNHIVHHLLSLFGVGASTAAIEKGYTENSHYQRPQGQVEERVLQDLNDPQNFKKYLGNPKHYKDFLVFFQKEMETKGWENVVNEYLFAGDERADDLLGRMYAGKFCSLRSILWSDRLQASSTQ